MDGTFLATYVSYAGGLALGFYTSVQYFGASHLSKDAKEKLTFWLWGEYDSSWSHHFCKLFDAVFGSKHLSWRCFLRSSVVSIFTVFALYLLLGPILGILEPGSIRTEGMELAQALMLGAALNVFPDYLSLLETRWLLKRFEYVKTVIGQTCVLATDALFTGLIIWIAINVYQLAWVGSEPVTAIEMLALFSTFSLFFYSTFITSVWAWFYCLSLWFMRIFSRTFLRQLLATEDKPVGQVALVGAALIFLVVLALTPLLRTNEANPISRFDDFLCTVFSEDVCDDVARLASGNKGQELHYLGEACKGGAVEHCMKTATERWTPTSDNDTAVKNDSEATKLFVIACEEAKTGACHNAGYSYEYGLGVPKDYEKAAIYYEKECVRGEFRSCYHIYNLGVNYAAGKKVPQSYVKAARLYQIACNHHHHHACNRLGNLFNKGLGVPEDDARAASLYQMACEYGSVWGCRNLGSMYDDGLGVPRDDKMAFRLYDLACKSGGIKHCNSLAWMLATSSVDEFRDGSRAVELAEKAVAEYPGDGNYLDTLAAAYAEVGLFEDAIRTQKNAIHQSENAGPKFHERLRSYRTGKPWRE